MAHGTPYTRSRSREMRGPTELPRGIASIEERLARGAWDADRGTRHSLRCSPQDGPRPRLRGSPCKPHRQQLARNAAHDSCRSLGDRAPSSVPTPGFPHGTTYNSAHPTPKTYVPRGRSHTNHARRRTSPMLALLVSLSSGTPCMTPHRRRACARHGSPRMIHSAAGAHARL